MVQRLEWFRTLRARLGATLTPDSMVYATGGLAVGGIYLPAPSAVRASPSLRASRLASSHSVEHSVIPGGDSGGGDDETKSL